MPNSNSDEFIDLAIFRDLEEELHSLSLEYSKYIYESEFMGCVDYISHDVVRFIKVCFRKENLSPNMYLSDERKSFIFNLAFKVCTTKKLYSKYTESWKIDKEAKEELPYMYYIGIFIMVYMTVIIYDSSTCSKIKHLNTLLRIADCCNGNVEDYWNKKISILLDKAFFLLLSDKTNVCASEF